jgi:hypothetical protein
MEHECGILGLDCEHFGVSRGMAVRSSKTESIEGDIRVADLRELVLRTESAPGSAYVEIRQWHPGTPGDSIPAKIAISWEES